MSVHTSRIVYDVFSMKLRESVMASRIDHNEPEQLGVILDRLMLQRGFVRQTLQCNQQEFNFGDGIDVDNDLEIMSNPHSDLPHGLEENEPEKVVHTEQPPEDLLQRRYREAIHELYPPENDTAPEPEEVSADTGLSEKKIAGIRAANNRKRTKRAIIHREVRNNARRKP